MNKLGKVLGVTAVGVAGYLVGFYEMKYKVMKLMVESHFDKVKKEKEEESE